MATKKVFLHGVPDTPAVWGPLLASLALPRDQVVTLSLPGFEKPAPTDFGGTKDDYARWLVGEIEPLHDEFGPVDIVGHDWGALLTQRAVSLRPELFRSWVISDALIEKSYPGHRNARMMNMPLVGELMMAIAAPRGIEKTLVASGVTPDIARVEAEAWRNKSMRKSILGLYRSADGLRFQGDWLDRLDNLPRKGLLLWGRNDPYVPCRFAQRFSEQYGVPLHIVEGAGHWAIIEKSDEVAEVLHRFWSEPD